MADDLYKALGVERNATDDQIKRAFRRKARELHPDVNKAADAEERFKEVNEAYDVLSNPQKRAQYDRFGTIPGAAEGGYQSVDFGDFFGMGDIFSSFFGGSRSGRQRREGRDMGIGVKITLEEAATGVKHSLVYDRLAPCDECGGTGARKGSGNIACSSCGGSGRVVTVQHTFLGDMQTQKTCPDCGGTGTIIESPCPECDGQGRVPDRCTVAVDIPPGVQDGQQMRITGYGEAGMNGAASGNLIVTVRVADHKRFERDGDNLYTQIDVSIVQAALGCEIETPGIMPGELIGINVPEGTQPGQRVRVKGKGMPRLRGSNRGDLIAVVNVVVPKNLSENARGLLYDLAIELGDNVGAGGGKSAFQRIKDAFS